MDQTRPANALPDIRKTMIFNASIHRVWDAVATSDGIAAWFMPNNFEPVEGQEFFLEAGPFGKSKCRVLEIDPLHRLSFQWGSQWKVTFELSDSEGNTQFTLIHAGWEADKVTEFGESHQVVRDRMEQGWGGLIGKLGALVKA